MDFLALHRSADARIAYYGDPGDSEWLSEHGNANS